MTAPARNAPRDGRAQRILVLGINYSPEIISTAVYTTGLAEHLAEAGHAVEVITALPYYTRPGASSTAGAGCAGGARHRVRACG